jgi:hypothetical protein
MKNRFGIELEKVNPGRRVSLALPASQKLKGKGQNEELPMFREEATIEGVMKSNNGSFVSIYVRRQDGSRARVGFDQVAEIVTARRKAA